MLITAGRSGAPEDGTGIFKAQMRELAEDKEAKDALNVLIEKEKAHLLRLVTLLGSKIN